MTTCAYCGLSNEAGSRFCQDCGKPLTASAMVMEAPAAAGVPATRVQPADAAGAADTTCPACGKAGDSTLPFCAFCGAPRTPGNAPSTPAARCPQCDTPVPSPDFRFCPSCASPLRASAAAAGATVTAQAARRSAAAIPVTLVQIKDDGTQGERHPLAGPETSIGRSGADLAFGDDAYLSPVHALFIYKDGKLRVRDLGSRNGTWVFISAPHRLQDGDMILVGSQVLRFRRLGYPGPHPPEADATRRMGSLVPSADIASLAQLRSDGSVRDVCHLSPGRDLTIGREDGDWLFPYDASMSGKHAAIRSEDADFVVSDAGSRNGVAVAARGDVELRKGSRVLVGDRMLSVEMP